MRTKHVYIGFSNRSLVQDIVVHFPGGTVEVGRAGDDRGWWAHIARDRHANTGDPDAVIVERRIDYEDSPSQSSSDARLTWRKDAYHITARIKEGSR